MAEGGAQAEDVGPHENAWSGAAGGMDEVAVGDAVGRGDVDVEFGDGRGVGHLRQHHGDSGA